MNQIKRLDWESKLNERVQIELTLRELLDIKLSLGSVSHNAILDTAKVIYNSQVCETLQKEAIHLDIFYSALEILKNNGIEEKI